MQERPEAKNQSESFEKKADAIIKNHVYSAAAAGLIPLPFVDFTAVAGIQMDLLRKLAKTYNVPFSKDMVKNIIGTLVGAAVPISASPYLFSVLKVVPIVGQTLGAFTVSIASGASTYAIGKIFNRHFAEGGTFLTFDPKKAKKRYSKMFKEGQKVAARSKPHKISIDDDKEKSEQPEKQSLQALQKSSPHKNKILWDEKTVNRNIALSFVYTGLASAGALFYFPLSLVAGAGMLYSFFIPLFKKALASLKARRIKIELLDSFAITAGIASGYFFASSLMCILYWTAQKLRIKTEYKSRESFINVFAEQPHSVWLLKNGVEVMIPFESLQSGDIVVVNTGEPIPADGIITHGIASIDQHILTGESQPVEKGIGHQVFATTVVLSGRLHIQVEKAGRETVVAKIGEILENTAHFTSSIESLGQEIADETVLPTLALSAGAYPIVGLPGTAALLCSNFLPCMRLTSPIGMLNFLHIASEEGILIKDGRSLQLLPQVDTVVFDKTGTLTLEQPHVRHIHIVNGIEENTVMVCAAAAEYRQNHPIARAIIEAALDRKLSIPNIDEANYKVGYGVTVKIDQQRIQVGSERFMEIESIDLPDTVDEIRKNSYEHGCSLVYVAADKRLIGLIELEPTIRPEAREIIRSLKERNMSLFIISGDHEKPTQTMAQTLEIDHYFAEVLPKNKAELIEQLQQQGKKVCFVGDGINDSIALKTANVSISMRGASTVAMDSAQIVLMDKTLNKLPALFDIADGFQNTMKDVFTAISAPVVFCIGGIFFANFTILSTVVLYSVSLVSGTTVTMLPVLKTDKSSKK